MSARNIGAPLSEVLAEQTRAEKALKVAPREPELVVATGGCGGGQPPAASAPSPDQEGRPTANGRTLLRIEARNAETPIERKPEWIKTRAKTGPEYTDVRGLVQREGLHTVCQEAGCPNIYECWEDREATFLIGGSICTRRCDFCQITSGKPLPLDTDEPRRVAESVRTMGLRYATITGVTRDDLPDTGAWLYAETIRQIHELNPGSGVEVLADDLGGRPSDLQQVFDAKPEVFAHNLETVPRLFRSIRPGFRYQRSLDVIRQAREAGMITKSNLILGMGEERAEVHDTMQELFDSGCDILTLTQYLRPSKLHRPVHRWVRPEEFVELKADADAIGFAGVLAGPLVRSSYRAGRLWAQTMAVQNRPVPENLQHLADKAADAFPQAV
ncbi:lipoyl synthase [Leucobacter sp. Psy1]|uniref:lipoyl synthase n=1 Tax=Leucobacter sp. Psy1 TaxID=2875729 RepID=UPI001CD3F400|nr:lipoyl synthase [Leucobacter sp. Psy1]UBH05593.1 lipoyl synthase [Leucobacter sp. Psy1]